MRERYGPGALTAYIGNPTAHNFSLGRYVGMLMGLAAFPMIYSAGTVDQWPKNLTAAQTAYWENVFKRVASSEEFQQYAARNQWENSYRGPAEARKFMEAQYGELKGVMTFLGLAK